MKRLLIAGVLAFPPFAAPAAEQFAPTAAEMRALPPFCADRIGKSGSGEGVPAATQMGKANWLHMHHYCFAVNFVNRATRARDPKDRTGKLQEAKNNYRYVIRATEPHFWMRPQFYVELGKVELQLKQVGEAVRLFNDAIEFNPAYEPAYQALIDVHRQGGRDKEALELATAGLRHLPDAELLKKAYLALGGKQPFPEPVQKAAPVPPEAPTAETEGPAAGAAVNSLATGGAQKPAGSRPAPGVEGAAANSGVEVPAGPESVPATGCRFCPPDEVQRRWRESFKGGRD